MIADEINKTNQTRIIDDFNYIKDVLHDYSKTDDGDIIIGNIRTLIITRYLEFIANKYGLVLINLNKDKKIYQLYKKGIYKKGKINPIDCFKDEEVRKNTVDLINKKVIRNPKIETGPSYISKIDPASILSTNLKYIQPSLEHMYENTNLSDDMIKNIYSYIGIPQPILDDIKKGKDYSYSIDTLSDEIKQCITNLPQWKCNMLSVMIKNYKDIIKNENNINSDESSGEQGTYSVSNKIEPDTNYISKKDFINTSINLKPAQDPNHGIYKGDKFLEPDKNNKKE